MNYQPSDENLRQIWRQAGGSFHGPNIEHGSIPEDKLFALMRRMLQPEHRFNAIRQAMGFVENASDTTVRIFQDDATRDFIVKVGTGGDSYYGPSLEQALDQLVKAVSEGKYAD